MPTMPPFEGAGFTRDQIVGRKLWEPWWSPLPNETELPKSSVAKAAAGESVREECEYCLADGSRPRRRSYSDPNPRRPRKCGDDRGHRIGHHRGRELRERLETKSRSGLQSSADRSQTPQVTGRLLRVQDEERRRIARELHDSAGQLLAALSMNLIPLEPKIQKFNPIRKNPDRQHLSGR